MHVNVSCFFLFYFSHCISFHFVLFDCLVFVEFVFAVKVTATATATTTTTTTTTATLGRSIKISFSSSFLFFFFVHLTNAHVYDQIYSGKITFEITAAAKKKKKNT